jgi:glutaredoxin
MQILIEFRQVRNFRDKVFQGGKMALVMYVKPNCPYCQKARDYYNENGIDFIEYDAQNDKQRQKEMLEYSGGDLVVPCIVENGEYIASGWGNPPRG